VGKAKRGPFLGKKQGGKGRERGQSVIIYMGAICGNTFSRKEGAQKISPPKKWKGERKESELTQEDRSEKRTGR